ncbi:acyl-CoA dehydrogenase family protein [Plantactinospora soyae]|uniref:Alkylation response protein AidB-like acyl-CoA dehydrogenase n=1 Tax=Plantactinospora soyae TaxID=1544732 RepID=A0A927M854_9ACTN|nr:acyl-CoA dehydrogenase family protein [Plantactinospora soyae]MBE1489729.1 alkylation response protein AidB-like acyl-CoA dehydrogenase [Plantactinospora soyae]
MVPSTEKPARELVIDRVRDILPALAKNAEWADENRRVHDESIEALTDAGVFKLRIPKRYGGYEASTRTLVDVAAEIATADGSTAWISSVYTIPTWMAAQFPEAAQDEIFSTPNVRICGTLSPGGMAAPVDGGIVVNGKWSFISGAHHAHWQEIIAILVSPDAPPMPVIAMVPMTQLKIVDDWHTAGLRGSGSVTTVAQDLFIPAERVLPLPAVLEGPCSSQVNAASAIYNAPLLPVASASSVGATLGLARAALSTFLSRLGGRKITYTGYESQADAPLTHLQVADAAMFVEEAEFHACTLAELVDTTAASGEEWKMETRVRARAEMGAVVRLAKQVGDLLGNASGGSSIYTHVPIGRITRDISAINQHALMHPDTNAELYGRVLCGLHPNTMYF